MSTLSLRRPRPWTSAVVETLTAIVEGIVEGHDIATRYQALSRLSDTELARLGLRRSDVSQAALRGVDGF